MPRPRDRDKPSSPKMLFSDLYKSPRSPLSRLRHSNPQTSPLEQSVDYDADLFSKDKAKQKEAVKRYLTEKVRNDWEFTWEPALDHTPDAGQTPDTHGDSRTRPIDIPRAGQAPLEPGAPEAPKCGIGAWAAFEERLADNDSDTASGYSTLSEDPLNFRSRAEWTSDLSDDDGPAPDPSPFRFDSPDAVGTVVQASANARKARRRKAVQEESRWNKGLACFLARRDAWTEARTVRLKPKPRSPVSPTSSRRLFWRSHHHTKSSSSTTGPVPASNNQTSPLSAVSTNKSASHHSQQGDGSSSSDPDFKSSHPTYPVETILPLPAPLLPPANPMRASITPALYSSLYDKIVVHSMQPSCPINLADMTRTCVAGWKRDGEWPPRPAELPAAAIVAVRKKKAAPTKEAARRESVATSGGGSPPRRRMSFGFLVRGDKGGADEKDREREKEKDRNGDKDKENKDKDKDADGSGKGIRRSLQRVLGLSHAHALANITTAGDANSGPTAAAEGNGNGNGNGNP